LYSAPSCIGDDIVMNDDVSVAIFISINSAIPQDEYS
jgi:hypothetical protein